MDVHSRIIPVHLQPLGIIEAFTHHGAPLDALLRHTGIDEQLLASTTAKISYHQYNTLLRNGIQACSKPGIGLLVGQYFKWCHHGTLGFVVECSPSLAEAALAFQRYVTIAQPYYVMYMNRPSTYLDEDGMLITPLNFTINPEEDRVMYQFEMEYRLAITLRVIDHCTNREVPDSSVHVGLSYPAPAHAHLYEDLPLTTVKFGCDKSYIAMSVASVVKPFRPLRLPAFKRLIAQCEQEFQAAKLDPSFSARVLWHISARFNEQVSLERVAEILFLSPRALTRRLAAENTSFRELQHEVRMGMTAYHLRVSGLSVDQIAEVMGFSSASSLRRAIKAWCGKTPSDIRAAGAPPAETFIERN